MGSRVFLGASVVLALVLSLYLTRGGEVASTEHVESVSVSKEMTEEERRSYVTSSVRLKSIEIVDEFKGDSGEKVAGMKRVRGRVVNEGTQPLEKLFVTVAPRGENGQVSGSYVEDILRNRALDPGAEVDFSYLIPRKSAFQGNFDRSLH